MFKNLKSKVHEIDPFDIVFGTIMVAGVAVLGIIAVDTIKADREETKTAIENGRRVVSIVVQKVIF